MEILFHRYGSICEPDIIEAFKSLGIAVDEENSEISEKNISGDVRIKLLAERILTKKPAFVFEILFYKHNMLYYNVWVNTTHSLCCNFYVC